MKNKSSHQQQTVVCSYKRPVRTNGIFVTANNFPFTSKNFHSNGLLNECQFLGVNVRALNYQIENNRITDHQFIAINWLTPSTTRHGSQFVRTNSASSEHQSVVTNPALNGHQSVRTDCDQLLRQPFNASCWGHVDTPPWPRIGWPGNPRHRTNKDLHLRPPRNPRGFLLSDQNFHFARLGHFGSDGRSHFGSNK